jgi:hypothetical protein
MAENHTVLGAPWQWVNSSCVCKSLFDIFFQCYLWSGRTSVYCMLHIIDNLFPNFTFSISNHYTAQKLYKNYSKYCFFWPLTNLATVILWWSDSHHHTKIYTTSHDPDRPKFQLNALGTSIRSVDMIPDLSEDVSRNTVRLQGPLFLELVSFPFR